MVQSTTTVVPTPAQFHIHMASAVDWRTQPPDSGWPSWRSDCSGTPLRCGISWNPMRPPLGAVGEAHHVAPLHVGLLGRVRVHRPGVHAVGAGVRLARRPDTRCVLTTVPSASTAQIRCWRPRWYTTRRPDAGVRREADAPGRCGVGRGDGGAASAPRGPAPDAESVAGRLRRRCRRRAVPGRAGTGLSAFTRRRSEPVVGAGRTSSRARRGPARAQTRGGRRGCRATRHAPMVASTPGAGAATVPAADRSRCRVGRRSARR